MPGPTFPHDTTRSPAPKGPRAPVHFLTLKRPIYLVPEQVYSDLSDLTNHAPRLRRHLELIGHPAEAAVLGEYIERLQRIAVAMDLLCTIRAEPH